MAAEVISHPPHRAKLPEVRGYVPGFCSLIAMISAACSKAWARRHIKCDEPFDGILLQQNQFLRGDFSEQFRSFVLGIFHEVFGPRFYVNWAAPRLRLSRKEESGAQFRGT